MIIILIITVIKKQKFVIDIIEVVPYGFYSSQKYFNFPIKQEKFE